MFLKFIETHQLLVGSATGVVIAAIVAGFAAILGHYITRKNLIEQLKVSQETARLQVRLSANLKLAEMRLEWINALRNDMAAFQAHGVTPEHNAFTNTEFYRLGTRIELFMNPADPDFKKLEKSLYDFLAVVSTEDKFAANPKFVEICQSILKREWDVLKREIQSLSTAVQPPNPPSPPRPLPGVTTDL